MQCRRTVDFWAIFSWKSAILAVLLVYSHQDRYLSATPASRLFFLWALINDRVWTIDNYHYGTPDKAEFEGSFYSDKAPGVAAIAIIPAFFYWNFHVWKNEAPYSTAPDWLSLSWISASVGLGLLVVVGGASLSYWLVNWISIRCSAAIVIILWLGSFPLPYSTMLFSHALVVALIAIATWHLRIGFQTMWFRNVDFETEAIATPWRNIGGGLALGWALASEYTAGIVVVSLGSWVLWVTPGRRLYWWLPSRLGWRRAGWMAVGALPPLLMIPAYSLACFGSPFILPYSLQASFPEMREGLYAIKWPDAQTAWNLLFSPTRGLFFWSPVLLLAFFGYGEVYRRSPGLFWLTYLVPALQVIVISGRVWDWQAGYTLGPRYLAPILPLLALPVAFGWQKVPWLGWTLGIYSVAITTLATLTDACPDYSIYNPLTELHIPLLLKGEFSPNLGMVLGLSPFASVALFYVILVGGFIWIYRSLPKEAPPRHEETTEGGRSVGTLP